MISPHNVVLPQLKICWSCALLKSQCSNGMPEKSATAPAVPTANGPISLNALGIELLAFELGRESSFNLCWVGVLNSQFAVIIFRRIIFGELFFLRFQRASTPPGPESIKCSVQSIPRGVYAFRLRSGSERL
jgi:hypothetical protein